jgi:hypothetical protein
LYPEGKGKEREKEEDTTVLYLEGSTQWPSEPPFNAKFMLEGAEHAETFFLGFVINLHMYLKYVNVLMHLRIPILTTVRFCFSYFRYTRYTETSIFRQTKNELDPGQCELTKPLSDEAGHNS